MTEPAMKAAYDVVQRVVMSAMKTLNLLNADRQQQNRFGLVPFEVNREAVAQDLTKTGGGLLSQMMSSYFLPPAKKTSSFEQRLRNAVHLLVEADAQSHKAIALSLCFSAIEAMVCEKTDGIVDELSRHVSVLLQPTAMERPKAIQAVKRLYNVRSKTLHGDALEEDETAWWSSRLLATGVLKAALDWQAHVTRVGSQPNRNDFLSELRTITATGQQMVGPEAGLEKFLPISS